MYNQLQLKRTNDFIRGRLAFVVTPSEYRDFIDYCEANGALNYRKDVYLTDSPPPIEVGHACVFYRTPVTQQLSWFCPAMEADTSNVDRVPFALMHDSQGIEPTKPGQVKVKELQDAVWATYKKEAANIQDWGVSKVEARHQLKLLSLHIESTRYLLTAMEETRQNIEALLGTE